MIALLTRIIEPFAAILVTLGIPAGESTLYALLLVYLLVSGLIAGFLLFILLRRRQCRQKSVLPSPDLES